MQQIANTLARDPQSSAILEGHTDDTGGEAYNLDLSSRPELLPSDKHSSASLTFPVRKSRRLVQGPRLRFNLIPVLPGGPTTGG